MRLSLSTLAFIMVQLAAINDEGSPNDKRGGWRPVYTAHRVRTLLDSYLSDWARKSSRTIETVFYSRYFYTDFTLRFFRIQGHPDSIPELEFGDNPISRETGRFGSLDGSNTAYLLEDRISLAMIAEYTYHFPCFTIVLLGNDWKRPTFSTGDELTSMFMFIGAIDYIVGVACDNWGSVFAQLDINLGVTVSVAFFS